MNSTQLLSVTFFSMLLLSAFLNTGYRLPAQIHQVTPAPVMVNDTINDDSVFTIVDKMPSFQGGTAGLRQFLGSHLKYPASAMEAREQGVVYVQFLVRSDGKTNNFSVVKGISPLLDQEAMRVVSMMPDWIPGEKNGQKVTVRYTLPIRFTLAPAEIVETKELVEGDQPPQFPGGMPALSAFLSTHMKYPEAARKANEEGKVYVQFIVTETGKVTNPTIVKSVSPLLDQEALRVVSMMPDWIPGQQFGKKVPVRYTLPLRFSLQ